MTETGRHSAGPRDQKWLGWVALGLALFAFAATFFSAAIGGSAARTAGGFDLAVQATVLAGVIRLSRTQNEWWTGTAIVGVFVVVIDFIVRVLCDVDNWVLQAIATALLMVQAGTVLHFARRR